jgi:hypothetical protein
VTGKRFSGLCAGGPLDGKKLAGDMKIIIVPIVPPSSWLITNFAKAKQSPVSYGEYVFNSDVEMWIWKGKWPVEGKPV